MYSRFSSSQTTVAILITAGLAAALLVVLTSLGDGSAAQSQVDVHQQTASRAYVDAPLGDTLWTLTRADDDVSSPVEIKEFGDYVFLLDQGGYRLARFDSDGAFLNTIGEGTGTGAGELQSIRGFSYGGSSILVVDSHEGRIQDFSFSGDLQRVMDSRGRAEQVQEVGGSLVTYVPFASSPFRVVDKGDDQPHAFGEEITEETSNPAAREGELVEGASGEIVFAPYYAGYVYVYNLEGELQRRIYTIDGFGFLGAQGTAAQYRRPGWTVRTRGAHLHDGSLYVHVWKRQGGEIHSVVDRYSWPDGQYLESFELPHQAQEFIPADERYYLVDNAASSVIALAQFD